MKESQEYQDFMAACRRLKLTNAQCDDIGNRVKILISKNDAFFIGTVDIHSAIENAEPGFKKGWVSLAAACEICPDFSPQRVAAFLRSYGYVNHPYLPLGSANRKLYPTDTYSSLFITPGHQILKRRRPCEIMTAYEVAQKS